MKSSEIHSGNSFEDHLRDFPPVRRSNSWDLGYDDTEGLDPVKSKLPTTLTLSEEPDSSSSPKTDLHSSLEGTHLLSPLIVHHSQYYAKRPLYGYQRLMVAVLEEAWNTAHWLRKHLWNGHNDKAVQLRNDLLVWVQDPDELYLFSFYNCCIHLGLDPGSARKRFLEILV